MSNRHLGNRGCPHDVYIKGMCGNCGIRLDPPQQSSSVSMIHSVPELKVSKEYAKEIGREDQERLISKRKLVLLVDLDQTLLHTTHEPVKNDPNVHSFQLWPGHPIYYTKLRPHLKEFLEKMSKIYELHIFTFGCRRYAHKIASIIDPEKKYFNDRILSRDESVDQYYKKGNLNNLFPCGDAMVCIIDDRADVWRDAGNLIQVKAYTYFKTSISDGAMFGSSVSPTEEDESLERDADQLEALLGLDGEVDATEETNKEEANKEEANVPETDGKSKISTKCEPSEEPDLKKHKRDDSEHGESQHLDKTNETESGPEETKKGEEEKSSTSDDDDEDKGVKDDPDDHLLYLPSILSRIHDKWYYELDEQRRYLVEGESYKLPDIKDIIKKYLRRKP